MKNSILTQNTHDTAMTLPRQYYLGLFSAARALFSPNMTVGGLPMHAHSRARVRVLFILFTILLVIKEIETCKIIVFYCMIVLSSLYHATVMRFFPLDGAPW